MAVSTCFKDVLEHVSHSLMYNQPGPLNEWDSKTSLKENESQLLDKTGSWKISVFQPCKQTAWLANHSLSLKSQQHVSFERTVPLPPLTLTFLTRTSRSLKKSMKVEETKMRTVRHPPKGEIVSRLFWSHLSFSPPWLQMCKMVFQHSSTCFSASGSDGSACRLSGRLPWSEA